MHGNPTESQQRYFDEAVEAFLKDRRAIVEVPVEYSITDLIPPVVEGVRKLIQDPARDKWCFHVNREGDLQDDPDDGLIRKDSIYGKDNKWFFHYRESLSQHLLNSNVDISPHLELLEAAHEMKMCVHQMTLRFAFAFDRAIPGYDLTERILSPHADDYHVLRVLVYDQASDENGTIGKKHTDKSVLTWQVAQNRPALYTEGQTEPYVDTTNKMLVFASDKLERLSRKRFAALPHWVVEQIVRALLEELRWAIIYFPHIRGFGAFPDSKT